VIIYKHTQIGWAILASMAVITIGLLLVESPSATGFFLFLMATMCLVFGWLTVIVDDVRVLCRFGIGLVRKSVRLSDIVLATPVRNRWYYGWGIRLTPVGRLYNVSGLSAIDFALKNGRHIRIGTDDPAGFRAALETRVRTAAGTVIDPATAAAHRGWVLRTIMLNVVLVPIILIGLAFVHLRPPSVHIDAGTLSVRSAFYHDEIPIRTIAEISLQDSIPHIVRRTNGFALGSTLRGHFRFETIGPVDLFIDRATPPFIVVRSSSGLLVLNFSDPGQTLRTYAQLRGVVRPAGVP
jgi:hypothetical protein